MPANKLIYARSEKVRDAITASQKREIARLYDEWAEELEEQAKYWKHKTTPSSWVMEQQTKILQKQLRATSQVVSNEVYKKIKQNMHIVSDAVVKDAVDWLKKFGFDEKGINAAFSNVPDSVVRNIITGNVYDSGWSLSKRIWGDNEATLKDAYNLVARGVAENKSMYDIAKSLETYVKPNAKLPWNLKMPQTDKNGKIIYRRIYKGQVDYNAQRLGRTLVQHSYQQSFANVNANNPFVLSYIWVANGSRVCPLCAARDGEKFPKDQLPLDHPNGMCTMVPDIDPNMEQKLSDWLYAEDGTYPEIDEFAKNFGYEPKLAVGSKDFTNKVNDIINKYGPGGDKTVNGWLGRMSRDDQVMMRELRKNSGMKWEDFYKQYCGGVSKKSMSEIYANYNNAKGMTKKAYAELIQEMKGCNDKNMLNALEKCVGKIDRFTNSGGAYWSNYNKTMNIGIKNIIKQSADYNIETKFHTLYHESGHCIDYNLSKKGSRLSRNKTYVNAMLKDLKNMFDRGGDTYWKLGEIFNDNNSRGIQDIVSGAIASGRYDVGISPRWAHSKDYWLRNDVDNEMASELFAHLTASKFSKTQTEYMKRCFPNALKEFDKLLAKNLK